MLLLALGFVSMDCFGEEESEEPIDGLFIGRKERVTPIFAKPFAINEPDSVIDTVYQNWDADSLYIAKILETSPLRYKVKYYIPWPPFEDDKRIGWVNKSDIGLYAFPCHEGDSVYIDGETYYLESMRIYEEPRKSSKFQDVLITWGSYVIFLDYKGPYRKVMFESEIEDKRTYIGWTLNYCDSPQGTCESGGLERNLEE